MCTFRFSLQGKLRVRGGIRELCVQPNSKAFGVWPDLQNLIVRLYCVLQYLRDLKNGSCGSLLGAWLLQTFPPDTCTIKCPVSPHSPVVSLTCLVIPRETQREAELLSWSGWSCSEARFSLRALASTPASPAGNLQKWVCPHHIYLSVLFQSALRQL